MVTTLTNKNNAVLRDIGTHFSIVKGAKGFLAYSLETCDKCKCTVQAANAIFVHEPRARLERFGMTFREIVPQELCCNDDGDAVCEDCAQGA